ncbi:MAG: tape measure protein [Cyanobacteria bacterium J06555_12]
MGATAAAASSVRASLELERIERTLRVVAGSSSAAAREFQFVATEARRLGLDLQTAAQQYASLGAAANGTELAGQATRDVFIAVAEASTVLGLSADQTGGALNAIQQIISKGTVSAEELRGQLGERLPGAFQIAARSIGVTTQELDKLLRNGELTAEELLPKLAAELRSTFSSGVPDAVDSTQAAFNRIKTSVFELTAAIADSSGLTAALRDAANAASTGADAINRSIKTDQATAEFDKLSERSEFLEIRLRTLTRTLTNPNIGEGRREGLIAQIRDAGTELAEIQRRLPDARATAVDNLTGGSFEDIRQAAEETEVAVKRVIAAIDIPERATFISEDQLDTIERFQQLSQEVATPLEALNDRLSVLNRIRSEALDAGLPEARVNEIWARSVREAGEAYKETTETVQEYNREIGFIFEQGLFELFDDGVESMVRAWARGLQRMLAQAAASNLFKALGLPTSNSSTTAAAGGGISAFFRSLFGFQDGGEFMVGGGGGIDSQLVAFRASPNERVTVTKPGQMASESLGVNLTYNIDARGSDERVLRILPQLLERTKEQTKNELRLDRQRGRF